MLLSQSTNIYTNKTAEESNFKPSVLIHGAADEVIQAEDSFEDRSEEFSRRSQHVDYQVNEEEVKGDFDSVIAEEDIDFDFIESFDGLPRDLQDGNPVRKSPWRLREDA